jgi:hypothetical protein
MFRESHFYYGLRNFQFYSYFYCVYISYIFISIIDKKKKNFQFYSYLYCIYISYIFISIIDKRNFQFHSYIDILILLVVISIAGWLFLAVISFYLILNLCFSHQEVVVNGQTIDMYMPSLDYIKFPYLILSGGNINLIRLGILYFQSLRMAWKFRLLLINVLLIATSCR